MGYWWKVFNNIFNITSVVSRDQLYQRREPRFSIAMKAIDLLQDRHCQFVSTNDHKQELKISNGRQ